MNGNQVGKTRVFVPRDFIRDEDITGYDILNYMHIELLQPIYKPEQYCIDVDLLLLHIYGTNGLSKKVRDKHFKSLDKLCNSKYIDMNRLNKKIYRINSQSFDFTSQDIYFTILYREELDKLINYNGFKRSLLIKGFAYIISTINTSISIDYNGELIRNFVGTMSQDYLAETIGISKPTLISYLRDFENLNIMYVYRYAQYTVSGEELHRINNLYGRYDDMYYIKKYAEEYLAQYKNIINPTISAEKSNHRRSLTQKYNNLCDGYEYPKDVVCEIYDHIRELNKGMKKKFDETGMDYFLEQVRDESVFDQFDYLLRE